MPQNELQSQLKRGHNPEPPDGWSWYLSDYEVAYVERFGVRPLRGDAWAETEEMQIRLDAEANAIHRGGSKHPRVPRMWRTLPVMILASIFIIGGVSAVSIGFIAYSEATSTIHEVETIREQIND